MKIAIVTEQGLMPITSADLSVELGKRIGLVTTRAAVLKALAEIDREVREQTAMLGPEHT